MDYARARTAMVESQIRTADVTDLSVLHAFRTLPRERFVPAALKSLAYADMELEVAPGRFLMRPRDLAKLMQALAPQRGERGLEIAGATGFGAAALSVCGVETLTLDPDSQLSFAAGAALEGVASVKSVSTDAKSGWAEGAPYDVILVNGAVETVPDAWLDQLADGGRLGVVVREGPAGAARVYTKSKSAAAYRTVFDAAPPVIPGLERARSFVF
ncbi:MAG: protein-L-isoaspartate O-methyltransferase [Hyphomonadaceae bacterium]